MSSSAIRFMVRLIQDFLKKLHGLASSLRWSPPRWTIGGNHACLFARTTNAASAPFSDPWSRVKSVAERGMYALHRNSRILNTRWIDELHQPVFIGPSGTATTFEWFSANTKSGVHTVCKSGGQPECRDHYVHDSFRESCMPSLDESL